MKTGLKRIISILLTLCVFAGFAGCSKTEQTPSEPEKTRYSKSYYEYFDTVSTIVGYEETEEAFLEKCDFIEAELDRYNRLYDIYHAYPDINNLYKVNRGASDAPMEVDGDVIKLLDFCREMYDTTGGKTNFAMGSVLSIWHEYRENGMDDPLNAALPPMEQLEAAAEHCDPNDVVIDREKSTVFFADPELKIDVGAIGKGYATERIARELIDMGVDNYTLNIGGNIRTIGTKANGDGWVAGIQNPDTKSSEQYLLKVQFNNLALVTSGSYQRYYYVGEQKYHHIIDPDTLMPKDVFTSVSILCPDSGVADALSTACFNLSLEDGMKLINSLENTEAMWVEPDGTLHFSDGFEAFVISEESK